MPMKFLRMLILNENKSFTASTGDSNHASHAAICFNKQTRVAMLITCLQALQLCLHIVEPNVCAGE